MPSKISQREAIRDSEKTDIPSLPLLAIRGFLCYRCLNHSDSLIKCSGCQRAAYCSSECQIADWHIQHKRQCKPLRKVNAVEENESDDDQTWNDYTDSLHQKAQLVKLNTDDEVTGETIQSVLGQPYCTTCHRSAIQVAPETALRPCTCCHLVFTCGHCISAHTKEECEHYRLLGEVEQYKLQKFEETSTITTSEPTGTPKLRYQYRPLSSAKSWLEYYTRISDKRHIGTFIDADFGLRSRAYNDVTRSKWLNLLLSTDSLTIPLTVLAGLEEAVPDLLDSRTVSIHLIGAAGKEFRSLKLFEEILHLLPSMKHLKIALIGPESPAGFDSDIDLDCCSTCTRHGRRRTVTSFQGGYQDYKDTAQYCKPDLAVLFHSGRSQANVESWAPTTRFLVDSATRTLCTTYTEREANEEAAELVRLGARFLIKPEVNKWRGLVPLPELLEGPEHGVYYNDYYRYIFEGRA